MTRSLIAHLSTGHGAPVLLLNGGLMTMMAWDPIATSLASEYQVVRCDFRGQLLSPGDPPATLDGHVDDVIAVLDALGLSDVHVIGTSFGALVGLCMAATRPQRVRSLVAGTATDHFGEEDWIVGQPLIDAARAAAAGTGDGGRVVDLLVPRTFSDRYRSANPALLAERRARVAALPPAYFAGLGGMLALFDGLDLRPLLGNIRCPTLVLAGAEDRTFPPERSRALTAAIPDAVLEIVPDAAHGVFVEEPARVAPILRAFLARVAATRVEA